MDTLTVILGFSAIGGLIAGYLTGRLAPVWTFGALLAVCVAVAVAAGVWLRTLAPDDQVWGTVLLFMILGPFTFCAAVAGVIGLLARRIIMRSQAQ